MPERTDLFKQALAVSKRAVTETDLVDAIAQLSSCIQMKPDSGTLYAHRGKTYLALNFITACGTTSRLMEFPFHPT